jgi:PEGA domain
MKRNVCLAALLTVSLTAGCVERRYIINSDPPGALVYHNGIYLGATPTDGYLVYYGKQKFTLVKEGYETLEVVQEYPPPWYEWPGVDFISENIWPFKVRDVRCIRYVMQPLQTVRPDEVRQRAEDLRSRGQTIGVPREPRPISSPVPQTPSSSPPPGATLGMPTPVNMPPSPVQGKSTGNQVAD